MAFSEYQNFKLSKIAQFKFSRSFFSVENKFTLYKKSLIKFNDILQNYNQAYVARSENLGEASSKGGAPSDMPDSHTMYKTKTVVWQLNEINIIGI